MPLIQTSTIPIDSNQFGNGPDLVMSHGLAANQAFWYFRIAPSFAKNYRVTLYDMRGHGNSAQPADGYTTLHLAEDLRGLLDAHNIEAAHLVGHSFGGAVTLHFASIYPERVKSITIIDCRVHALQPFGSMEDQPYWDTQKESAAARGHHIPPGTPRWLMPLFEELETALDRSEGPGILPGLKPRQGLWDPNRRSAKKWIKLIKETTFLEDLRNIAGLTSEVIGSIKIPTYLIYGETSLLIKTFHELNKLLPASRTSVLPNVGHFFPLVRPELVIDNVTSFLQEHSG